MYGRSRDAQDVINIITGRTMGPRRLYQPPVEPTYTCTAVSLIPPAGTVLPEGGRAR